MCELLGFSARLPSRLRISLDSFVRQAGVRNPHGWGIAYYQDSDAFILREAEPAPSSPIARLIAEAGAATQLAIAHVRYATSGGVALKNTHPFTREMGGATQVFAFNGDIGPIFESGPRLTRFQPVGETDAELAFCLLLERLQDAADSPVEDRAAVIHRFGSELMRMGPANFLYADGGAMYAFSGYRKKDGGGRAPGLFTLQRVCELRHDRDEREVVKDMGDTLNLAFPCEELQEVTLVASVPITEETWVPLGEHELVAIRDGRVVLRITA